MNHLSSVIRQIPLSVQSRLSKNPSNKELFNEKKKKKTCVGIEREVNNSNLCFKDQTDPNTCDNRQRKKKYCLVQSTLQHASKN